MDERAADLLDDGRLDALGRLVEDEKFRLRHQSASDGELLLLAAGKIAAAPPEHVAQHREEREDLVVEHALGARKAGEAGHQVLAHCEEGEDFAALRDIAEAGARPQMARQTSDVLGVPADRARRPPCAGRRWRAAATTFRRRSCRARSESVPSPPSATPSAGPAPRHRRDRCVRRSAWGPADDDFLNGSRRRPSSGRLSPATFSRKREKVGSRPLSRLRERAGARASWADQLSLLYRPR